MAENITFENTMKKKVEWRGNHVGSNEPHQQQQQQQQQHEQQPAENRSPMWDSEDEMLSYFLDSNTSVETPPTAPAHFPSAAAPSHRAGVAISGHGSSSNNNNNSRSGISDRILQHPFRTHFTSGSAPGSSVTMRRNQLLGLNSSSKNNNSNNGRDGNGDLPQPPPTPVIQHYFPSSSASSSKKKPSSNNINRSSATTPGIRMPQPTHQYPFDPHHQQGQHQFINQKQQQQRQPQHSQPLDPIQAMKRNYLGAFNQQFTLGGGNNNNNTNKNNFAFPGYNATMEERSSPISPALEFGGDHEELYLPSGKGGYQVIVQYQQQQQQQQQQQHIQRQSHSDFSSQINALTGAYNKSIAADSYGISSGNRTELPPTIAVANSSSNNNNPTYEARLKKNLDTVISSQQHLELQQASPHMGPQLQQSVLAAQKQFTQSSTVLSPTSETPSSSSVAQQQHPAPIVTSAGAAFQQQQQQQHIVPIHPAAAAAIVAGVNNQFYFPNFAAAYLMQKAEGAEETEEKRAKRLERNRESARKSRRRKKERLSNLEEKVNKLYLKIETERRIQINSMDNDQEKSETEGLLECRKMYAPQHHSQPDRESYEQLRRALSRFFIDQRDESIRKEVVEFQYNSLSQHLLPRYQKLFLWKILQSESYFLLAKEEHAKRDQSKKITMGKISSKQLGEEITNGRKQRGSSKDEQGLQSACVSDAERFWPLMCFELSISVEQEERFLEAQRRLRQIEVLRRNANHIVAATRLSSSVKEAVLYQIYLATFRKRKTYCDILTPRQAIIYKEWWLSNRARARNALNRRKRPSALSKHGLFVSSGSSETGEDDLTLERLCRYLEESLKVTKSLPG